MTVTVKNGTIKMPDVNDTVTMHCVRCEVVDGQFGEQVKFTDTRGDALYLPRESADRQLSRIGFVDGEQVIYGDVDGTTLIFSRDPNSKTGARPYWGIRRVVQDDTPRPSLVEAAKAEAERVRKAKGLPKDDGGSMGPYIPGLDDDPDDPGPTDPYADDDGMPPQKPAKPVALSADHANKEGAINAAYARAYAFVLGVQGDNASPDSAQAGAATVLIAYGKAGTV